MVCKYSEPIWILRMKYIGGRTLNPFDVFDDDDDDVDDDDNGDGDDDDDEEEKEEENEEERVRKISSRGRYIAKRIMSKELGDLDSRPHTEQVI